MKSFPPLSHSLLLTLAGTGICTAGAAIAAAVFTRFPGRAFVPIIFVVLIAISAAYFGAAAGMLGTLIAALVFATWLYAPIGGLAVQNPAARTALAWMVLGGVSLSFLLAPESPHKQ